MAKKQGLKLDEATWHLARRLWLDWVQPHWRRLAVAMLLMLVVAGATAAYPLLIEWAFALFEAGDMRIVTMLLPLVVLATAVKGGALYLQTVMIGAVVFRVITNLQKAMFGHLLAADLARLIRDPTGTLISRFVNDVNVMRDGMQRAATNLVRDTVTVVALVGVMIYMDWVLTLIVMVVYPLAAIPIIEIGRRLRRVSAGTQEHIGEMTAFLGESLAGARMVKTYGLEGYQERRAGDTFEGLYRFIMRAVRGRSAIDPMLEVLGGIAVGGVIAFAGYRTAVGEGSVGEFTGFITALLLLAQPVRALGTLNTAVQEGLAAVQRVFTLLDEQPQIVERPDAKPLQITDGRVTLSEVEFGYGTDASALDHVSLDVAPGSTTALVGPSGAGKSTVLNLIPRLFDTRAGTVQVDGQDVRDVTFASLRSAMALVSQDVVLFNVSIRQNIAFGRPDATEAEIVEAAKAAAAHDFIAELPEGYDTVVGDRGVKLSGGERQRVALARAMLRDARILLLDEATSALDAESERRVQEALERLKTGRTTLVIAHRLSTVRNADRIYVLDQGRVAEAGTHDTLIAQDGLYAKLCRMQFFADAGPDTEGVPDEAA